MRATAVLSVLGVFLVSILLSTVRVTPVSAAVTPPECVPLSGNTVPALHGGSTVSNSGAMYFGKYSSSSVTASPTSTPKNKPVYYAPDESVACAIMIKGAKGNTIDLRGWVWNDNLGWISLYCPGGGGRNQGFACGVIPYGVRVDPATGDFSGYAWSNAGWVRMNCKSSTAKDSDQCATSPYLVKLDLASNTVKDPTSWAWTSGVQWMSFSGMTVPALIQACDPATDPAHCKTDVLDDNAQFISQTIDGVNPGASLNVAPKSSHPVAITMKNTGTSTWIKGIYQLSSLSGMTWGFSGAGLMNDVAPGESHTFNFNLNAPATVGTYSFQWQMSQKTKGVFGDKSDNVQITVVGNGPGPGPGGGSGSCDPLTQICSCDPLTHICITCDPKLNTCTSCDPTLQTCACNPAIQACGACDPDTGVCPLSAYPVDVGVPLYADAGAGFSSAINPVSPAQVRNLVYRNVQQWKKVASTSCGGGSLLLQYDTGSTGDTVYYCQGDVHLDAGSKWSGDKTIIVEGGNVYIEGSLYPQESKQAGQLGIIVLRSKLSNKAQGNVYIYPDVRDLHTQIYADGSIYPFVAGASLNGDGSPKISPSSYGIGDGSLFGQLYFRGVIIADNYPNDEGGSLTLGGSLGAEQLKNLGFLRSFPKSPDPDVGGGEYTWGEFFKSVVAKAIKGVFTLPNASYTLPTGPYLTSENLQSQMAKDSDKNDYIPTVSVIFQYEPPANDLPGFEGILSGQYKQTGSF